MVYIESAFLGDEKTARNITKVLREKIVGTSLNVHVDEKLIPNFDYVNKTEINTVDEKRIRDEAVATCGEANQSCITQEIARLEQVNLRTLVDDGTQDTGAPLKGLRLTVNIIDNAGKRKRMITPAGNDFELDGLTPVDPRKPDQTLPPMSFFRDQVVIFIGGAFAACLWVFGVAATYVLFSRKWGINVGIAAALVALLLPGSGYVLILGAFGIKSFVDNYVSMV